MCISAPETNRDDTRRAHHVMQNAATEPTRTDSPLSDGPAVGIDAQTCAPRPLGSVDAPPARQRKRDKAKLGSKKLGLLCLQFTFLAGVCYVGSAVSDSLPISIPGNICSMVILLTLLISGIVAEDKIALASNFLLRYMPVFFIPAGVTIITSLPLIQGRIPQFVLVCLLTTFMVFLATSVTVIAVTRLQKYFLAKQAGEDVKLRKVFSIAGDPILAAYDPSLNENDAERTQESGRNEADRGRADDWSQAERKQADGRNEAEREHRNDLNADRVAATAEGE